MILQKSLGLLRIYELYCFFQKNIINRFTEKLDTEPLEAQFMSQERLQGSEYRAILTKMNDMLIDINAHLESGHRYYNSLFEK